MFEIGISHFLTCDKVSWNNDLYQWTGATKPNGTTTYTSNGLNQYTAVTGVGQTAFPPAHDANGNLTAASHWTYTYDSDNRLKTAISTDLATPVNGNLTYDAQGRLRQTQISIGGVTKTSQLLYDGVDLVAEYDAVNTLQRRYVHGPGVDEPLIWYEGNGTTAKSWLYADHLGSIIATANASGASSNINTYGPFGESAQTTPDNNRFGYTGQQQLKGLGLNYYKARVYSPALGRFLQADPIGYADDLNLYSYVGGNPVNGTDPSGLVANWAKGITLTDFGNTVDNFMTGGFGQLASQSFGSGNLGDGLLYTGAGVAFGVTNALSLGQGTAASGLTKGTVTVGRWMSEVEHTLMVNSGKVVESRTLTTHVANPANAETFMKQAAPGSRYVEFGVPSNSLKMTGQGVAKVIGPNSLEGRLAALRGSPVPQMPTASDISWIASKLR